MRILLINPPVHNDIGRILAETPPLGLMYLAGYLEQNGYQDVKVLDADANRMNWQRLAEYLTKEKPDIVGITGPSLVLPALIKTVKLTRKVLPRSTIIAGGYGPSMEPEKVLRSVAGGVNFIVLGEGEITLLNLLKKLENSDTNYQDLKGIACLDENNQFVVTQKGEYIKDLDSLPWPAYHLLIPSFDDYAGMHAQYKEMQWPNAVMVASRGCPHRCTFCSLGSKIYRKRAPKHIVDEMESYIDKFKVNSIQLYDDEFVGLSPSQNQWIGQVCDEIISRGLNRRLRCLVQGRCSKYVDLEVLKLMYKAGFRWIWWGVESGSQKILDSIQKDIQVQDVIHDFKLATKAGLKSMMFIMVGFPGETKEDIGLTAKLIRKVKPDEVRIHILSPYPGSKLYTYFKENDLFETEDYYKFDTRNTVIHHTQEMSAEEIEKYYRMLVFRFENGYWYFIKFLAKSLLSLDGWKKLAKRFEMAAGHFTAWSKVAKSSE